MGQVKTSKLLVMLALIAALASYSYVLRYRETAGAAPPALDAIPETVGDYAGRDEYREPESLLLLGADATLFRSYRNGTERTVWLFIGHFGSQQENSQIHSPKHCYPGAGWNIVEEGSVPIRTGDATARVKHLTISDGREQRIILYWFNTYSGIITDEFALKWHQVKSALLAKTQSATFVRFSTVAPRGSEERSLDELIGFVESMYPMIERALAGRGCTGT